MLFFAGVAHVSGESKREMSSYCLWAFLRRCSSKELSIPKVLPSEAHLSDRSTLRNFPLPCAQKRLEMEGHIVSYYCYTKASN